ncbi:MAG: hypothetical protein H6922_01600 [Pseudomonadaceae bacterium]|nr:hypothetical protein [Pseudomonadaceae bacterium]
MAQSLALKAGAMLVPQPQHALWQYQRLALLAEAAELYRETLPHTGATGYVFSFNRPVQLHACLASYFHHAANPVPLVVQYEATYPEAAKVYGEVEALMKDKPVTFVKETTCRDTFLATFAKVATRKVFFLMDDIVFLNPVDMAQFTGIDPLAFVPTLRMHPGLSRCYTMNAPQPPPATLAPSKTHVPMLQWTWGDAGNEWDDPMSLDGNLFDTAEVMMIARASIWKAPNSLESAMKGFAAAMRPRPGLCYAKPVLVNNPCNRVQTEVDNRAGEESAFSPEQFLAAWAKGQRIHFEALAGTSTTGPHQEFPFGFIAR